MKMYRTTQILGAMALIALSTCTPAHADSYDDALAAASTPQPQQTYGYVSTQQVDRDYQLGRMQRDMDDEHYFTQQELTQQRIIQAGEE